MVSPFLAPTPAIGPQGHCCTWSRLQRVLFGSVPLCWHRDFSLSRLGLSAAAGSVPAPGLRAWHSCVHCDFPQLVGAPLCAGSLGLPVGRASALFAHTSCHSSSLLPSFRPGTPASSSRNQLRGLLPSLSGFIIHPFSFPFSTDWVDLSESPQTLVSPLGTCCVWQPYG